MHLHDTSNQDALDLIERDLILAAVVKPGGASTFVVGHLLGDFKFSAIAQVLGNAGGAEGVATDAGFHMGIECTPPDHPVDIGLTHGCGGQRAGASYSRAEHEDRKQPAITG